jgi:hypothetical protein
MAVEEERVSKAGDGEPCEASADSGTIKSDVWLSHLLITNCRLRYSDLAPSGSVFFEHMVLNRLVSVVVPGKFTVTALDKAAFVMMLLGMIHVLHAWEAASMESASRVLATSMTVIALL